MLTQKKHLVPVAWQKKRGIHRVHNRSVGYSQYMQDKLRTLEAICNAFGISVSQFFSDSELTELPPTLQEIIDKWPTLNDPQRAAMSNFLHSFDIADN